MEYLFTKEQTQFRESLQNFFRKHSPTSEVRRLMETQLGFDREVWKNACGSLGLSGIAIPEEYGGSGFGPVELSIVCEEMGRSLYCSPFLGSVICAGSAINLSSANEETKEQYLSRIASGEIIAALAVTENKPMWGDENFVTAATPIDKNTFQLTGEKNFVISANAADVILVITNLEERATLFAVERDAEGLDISDLSVMDPTRKMSACSLDKTPAKCVGSIDLETLCSHVLIYLSNEMIGGAQQLLDSAIDYTKLRFQFGRSIASFQAIKHRLAELLLELELAKSACYQAAQALADNEKIQERSSLAKSAANEAFLKAGLECIQLHGGIGFTWENDTHLWFKRAKSSEVLLGNSAMNYERLLLAIPNVDSVLRRAS